MKIFKESLYLQITNDIKHKIEVGFLKKDDKLESCRELAYRMGVNPNTVQRAYSELEADGYIYTVPKKGVYVAGGKGNDLTAIAEKKIRELKNAGLTREEINKITDKIYGEKNDTD